MRRLSAARGGHKLFERSSDLSCNALASSFAVWNSNSNASSPALSSHLNSIAYAPSSHVTSSTQRQTAGQLNQPPRRSPSPLAPLLPAATSNPLDLQRSAAARERSVPINAPTDTFSTTVVAGSIHSPPSTSLLPSQHPQLQHRQLPTPQHLLQQPQQLQSFPPSFPNAGAAGISHQQLAIYQQQLQLNQQQQQQLTHEHQLKLDLAQRALQAVAAGQHHQWNPSSVVASPIAFNEQQLLVNRQRSGPALSPNVALQPQPSFLPMDVDPLALQRQLHEQMMFQEKLLKQQQDLLALKQQQEQMQLLVQSPIAASLAQAQPFVAAADSRSPQTWQQQQPQHYQPSHPQQPLPAAALAAHAVPTSAIVIPPLVRRSSSLFDHSPSPVAAAIPAVAVGGASKYTPSPPPPPISALVVSSSSPRASPGVSRIGNLQGLASAPKESKVAEIICGATDATSPTAPMTDVPGAPNSGATGSESPTHSHPRGDDLLTASSRRARIVHMTKTAPTRFSRIGRAIVKMELSSPEPPSSTLTQARTVAKRESPATKRARKKKQVDTESDEDDDREERKAAPASDNSDDEANSDDSNGSDSAGDQEDEDDEETSEADEKPRRKAKAARKSSPSARTLARKSETAKKKESSPRSSPQPVKLNANGKPKREKGSSCHQVRFNGAAANSDSQAALTRVSHARWCVCACCSVQDSSHRCRRSAPLWHDSCSSSDSGGEEKEEEEERTNLPQEILHSMSGKVLQRGGAAETSAGRAKHICLSGMQRDLHVRGVQERIQQEGGTGATSHSCCFLLCSSEERASQADCFFSCIHHFDFWLSAISPGALHTSQGLACRQETARGGQSRDTAVVSRGRCEQARACCRPSC